MGSLFSRRLPRIKMAVSSLIFLAMIATSLADLGCNDFSYNLCHDPPADQELHVGSREECIQNCDLFGSFGKCDYLLWFGLNGPDENCKIISGPGEPAEEMAKYVSACSTIGQPIKNTAGDCMEGPQDECAGSGCDAGCADCTNDPCSGYKRSQCLKQGEPGETSSGPPNYGACLTFCTFQMTSNPWIYLTYDQESQECICYDNEDVNCSLEVIIYGMSETWLLVLVNK